MSIQTLGDGVWCVVGEFNAVTCAVERKGINVDAHSGLVLEMNHFNTFLSDVRGVTLCKSSWSQFCLVSPKWALNELF